MSELRTIIKEAISDYQRNGSTMTPQDWLQGYLSAKLPDKAPEEIASISNEIAVTINTLEQQKESMIEAAANGISSETWFVKEMNALPGSNGEKAHLAVELMNGVAEDGEIIDIEQVDEAEWLEDNWNDLKLKDTMKNVAVQAGSAGLREIASDIVEKVADEGIIAAVTDKDFVIDTVGKGVDTGFKFAVTAGLEVAADCGIISERTHDVLATIAHKAVETGRVIREVIKGNKTIVEAASEIKDTAVTTAVGIVKNHAGNLIKDAVTTVANTVFGPIGRMVTGVVGSIMTEDVATEERTFKSTLKSIGRAAVNVLTKEVPNPFKLLKKAKNLIFG